MPHNILLLSLILVSGGLLSIQGPMNGELGKILGSPTQATFISFLTGSIALLVIILVQEKALPTTAMLSNIPRALWLGGLLGAAFVVIATITVPIIGATNFLIVSLLGQILVSLAIDHFGYFSIIKQPLNTERLLGVLLVICGVLIINKKSLLA